MRYVYSTIRFVPDSARGEFINIGIIAGSDETQEWVLRQVSNYSRAGKFDTDRVLPEVMKQVTEIAENLDRYTAFAGGEGGLFPPEVEVSESWLIDLVHDSANLLQVSPPVPIRAESAEEAIELLWPVLIAE